MVTFDDEKAGGQDGEGHDHPPWACLCRQQDKEGGREGSRKPSRDAPVKNSLEFPQLSIADKKKENHQKSGWFSCPWQPVAATPQCRLQWLHRSQGPGQGTGSDSQPSPGCSRFSAMLESHKVRKKFQRYPLLQKQRKDNFIRNIITRCGVTWFSSPAIGKRKSLFVVHF